MALLNWLQVPTLSGSGKRKEIAVFAPAVFSSEDKFAGFCSKCRFVVSQGKPPPSHAVTFGNIGTRHLPFSAPLS